MELEIKPQSDAVTAATLTSDGQVVEQLVADTATGTAPVPTVQYVADQGGVAPILSLAEIQALRAAKDGH